MPKIRIIKSIAKRNLESRIDEGKRLTEQSADAGPINTNERFIQVQDELDRWSRSNIALLRRFFDDDSLEIEYSGHIGGGVDEENSRLENLRALRRTIETQVAWLTDLVNRIDDFAQSERTPIATRH